MASVRKQDSGSRLARAAASVGEERAPAEWSRARAELLRMGDPAGDAVLLPDLTPALLFQPELLLADTWDMATRGKSPSLGPGRAPPPLVLAPASARTPRPW